MWTHWLVYLALSGASLHDLSVDSPADLSRLQTQIPQTKPEMSRVEAELVLGLPAPSQIDTQNAGAEHVRSSE